MLGTVFAGTATAGALVAAGYQSMSPTGQWYGRTFTGLARGSKQLALTYDDGPNDPHTFRLLEVLARHNVCATFFLIGRYTKQRPDIVRELVKAGHIVGNHTFTHPLLTFKSSSEVRKELARLPLYLARCHRRTLETFPSTLRWTPSRCPARRARIGLAAGHVERHRLRLECAAGRRDRAEMLQKNPWRQCDPPPRRWPQNRWAQIVRRQ